MSVALGEALNHFQDRIMAYLEVRRGQDSEAAALHRDIHNWADDIQQEVDDRAKK